MREREREKEPFVPFVPIRGLSRPCLDLPREGRLPWGENTDTEREREREKGKREKGKREKGKREKGKREKGKRERVQREKEQILNKYDGNR